MNTLYIKMIPIYINDKEVKRVMKNPQDYTRDKCLEQINRLIQEENYATLVYLCEPAKKGGYTVAVGTAVLMCIYLAEYDKLRAIPQGYLAYAFSHPLAILHDGKKSAELICEYFLWNDTKMPRELRKKLIDLIEPDNQPKTPFQYTLYRDEKLSAALGKVKAERIIMNIEELLPLYEEKSELLQRLDTALLVDREKDFFELYEFLSKLLREEDNADFFIRQIHEYYMLRCNKMSRNMYEFLSQKQDLIYQSSWYAEIMMSLSCWLSDGYERTLWAKLVSRPDGFLRNIENVGRDKIYVIGEREGYLYDVAAVTKWYQKCVKRQPELNMKDKATRYLAELIFLKNKECDMPETLFLNLPDEVGGFELVDNVACYFIRNIHFTGLEQFLEEHAEEIFSNENIELLTELMEQYEIGEPMMVKILSVFNRFGLFRSIPFVLKQIHSEGKATEHINVLEREEICLE